MTIILAKSSGDTNLDALRQAKEEIHNEGEAQVKALQTQSGIEQQGLATAKDAVDKVKDALDGEVGQVKRQTGLLSKTYDEAHAFAVLKTDILYEPPSIGGLGVQITNNSKIQARNVRDGGEFFNIQGFDARLVMGHDPALATQLERRSIGFIPAQRRSNLVPLGFSSGDQVLGHVEVGCENCEDKEYWILMNRPERSTMNAYEVSTDPKCNSPRSSGWVWFHTCLICYMNAPYQDNLRRHLLTTEAVKLQETRRGAATRLTPLR